MVIVSFGSSSFGSCYLIKFKNLSVVIDAGINVKQFTNHKYYSDLMTANLLLISHEHIDHVKYLKNFLTFNNRASVIIHPLSFAKLMTTYPELEKYKHRFVMLDYFKHLKISGLHISTLQAVHDSAANNAYQLTSQSGEQLFFITDWGSFDYLPIMHHKFFSNCIFMIESNHPADAKQTQSYQERSFSNVGHSNSAQALRLVDIIEKQSGQNIKNNVFWISSSPGFYEHLKKTDPYGKRIHPTNIEEHCV